MLLKITLSAMYGNIQQRKSGKSFRIFPRDSVGMTTSGVRVGNDELPLLSIAVFLFSPLPASSFIVAIILISISVILRKLNLVVLYRQPNCYCAYKKKLLPYVKRCVRTYGSRNSKRLEYSSAIRLAVKQQHIL